MRAIERLPGRRGEGADWAWGVAALAGRGGKRMGKIPSGIRLKEVVYTLSPFEQNIMGHYFAEIRHSIAYTMKKHIVFDMLPFCILPLGATVWYCNDFKEKEKMEHRY